MSNWALRYANENEICGCGEPAVGVDGRGYPACTKHRVQNDDPFIGNPSPDSTSVDTQEGFLNAWNKTIPDTTIGSPLSPVVDSWKGLSNPDSGPAGESFLQRYSRERHMKKEYKTLDSSGRDLYDALKKNAPILNHQQRMDWSKDDPDSPLPGSKWSQWGLFGLSHGISHEDLMEAYRTPYQKAGREWTNRRDLSSYVQSRILGYNHGTSMALAADNTQMPNGENHTKIPGTNYIILNRNAPPEDWLERSFETLMNSRDYSNYKPLFSSGGSSDDNDDDTSSDVY